MRTHLRSRPRGASLTTISPTPGSADYSPALAKAASSILYRSPIRSRDGHVVYILNAAALPDTYEVDYDSLLPYVLSRLPGEDDLVSGTEYEVVFFSGSGGDGVTTVKKNRPGWGWVFRAYHVLTRAMRKRIRKLYLVHEKSWVRMLAEMFSTVASPKFRRKIVHASSLTALVSHIPIEDLLIPPSAYLQDRRQSPDIHSPNARGRRAFGARIPLPRSYDGKSRLPRVLRETSRFILLNQIVQTEGLFRIPAQVKMKEILKEAYDRGQKFIAWKENGVALPFPNYPNAESANEILAEVDQIESYGVHLAAGLLKYWYSELREPIVPQMAYREFVKTFGTQSSTPTLDQLRDLLSPSSDWSPLTPVAREILTRHLIPLLAAVAEHQSSNKMSADNLAVCFAPALLCGLDQLEDIKISNLIRNILSTAVQMWPQLREACKISPQAFEEDLKGPARIEDYEDAMDYEFAPQRSKTSTESELSSEGPVELDSQISGIILKDNESQGNNASTITGDGDNGPPPLPPRSSTIGEQNPSRQNSQLPPHLPSRTSTGTDSLPPLPPRSQPTRNNLMASNSLSDDSAITSGPAVRRKPAPPLSVPPRYSTIIGNSFDVTESPVLYSSPVDTFGCSNRRERSIEENTSDLHSSSQGRPRSSSQIKRKPITPINSKDEYM